MKYVKFKMVDHITGISVNREESLNGAQLPYLGDMTNLFVGFGSKWYYAEVGDDAPFDSENFITELTLEEYTEEIRYLIILLQESAIEKAYVQEKQLRDQLFGKYHESVTTAGINKYKEALDVINGGEISSCLKVESDFRNISAQDLARKIINNYDKFRETDAKVSGLRGMIVDRISSFIFDSDNPYQSLCRYQEKENIPNVRLYSQSMFTIGLLPTDEMNVENIADLVEKHDPELQRRWEYLIYQEQQNTSGG